MKAIVPEKDGSPDVLQLKEMNWRGFTKNFQTYDSITL